MQLYRLKIKEGKIIACKEAIQVSRNSEYVPESDLFFLMNKEGSIISIVCPANSKAWAQRIATDFLEKHTPNQNETKVSPE